MNDDSKLYSDRLTYMLSSIQADIQVVKNDLNYMKQFVDSHDSRFEKVEKDVEEIQKHVSRVEGGVKLLSVIGTIAGILAFIYRVKIG